MRTIRLRSVRMAAAGMPMFAAATATVDGPMSMRVRQLRDNNIQRHDGETEECRCSEVPGLHD